MTEIPNIASSYSVEEGKMAENLASQKNSVNVTVDSAYNDNKVSPLPQQNEADQK